MAYTLSSNNEVIVSIRSFTAIGSIDLFLSFLSGASLLNFPSLHPSPLATL